MLIVLLVVRVIVELSPITAVGVFLYVIHVVVSIIIKITPSWYMYYIYSYC